MSVSHSHMVSDERFRDGFLYAVWDFSFSLLPLHSLWQAHLTTDLNKEPKAAVTMPSDEEIKAFQDSITARYSTLENVYAVADRLKLYLQQSGDAVRQNMFYNGWTDDHYVGNVLSLIQAALFLHALSTQRVLCAIRQ